MLARWTVLGSGGAIPTPERGQPGHILEAAGERILVDAGGTVPLALQKFFKKTPMEIFPKLNAILISHRHFDHTDGLMSIIGALITLVRHNVIEEKPLIDIYLPGYSEDLKREVKSKFPEEEGLFYQLFQLRDFSRIKETILLSRGIKIRIDRMAHVSDYFTAFGFRFTISDKVSIVYSGDTGLCNGLYSLLREPFPADLAILEATLPPGLKSKEHLNPRQAGRIARECGVKQLVLVHLLDPLFSHYSQKEIAEEARKEFPFPGKLSVAEDGQIFTFGE